MSDWRMPEEFGDGGREIIRHLLSDSDDVSTRALIVEAARAKDLLDSLNRITSGDVDTWTRVFVGEGELVLKIDTAVSQQLKAQTNLRQLLAEIQRRQSERPDESEEDGLANL
ncbi:hypothetical protein [Corynebacterium cystitidis]|uniref:hypothetical protein n=1 Tax=Corynebacterium cystitidis TaxID=35757 RepID=UPI00211E09BE|nr:hypothetical protein [Corynebacterium cystitidis]